jgi:hypothetical protein
MNYKGVKDKVYTCLHCSNEFTRKYYSSTPPKYCSNRCQHDRRIIASNEGFDQGEVVYFETQKRILTERFGYQCATCSINEWHGQTLVLQVDHIDGDPGNNKGGNLRLLCPNCHSLTPTYKGGNKNNPKQDRRSRQHRSLYARVKTMSSE